MSARSQAVEGLMLAAEAKDAYARGHGRSVALGSLTVARELRYADADLEALEAAALLHDVGNLEVDASILGKSGHLTSEEFDQIRQHPTCGARLLRTYPDLRDLAPFVEGHHERWDGNGYPHGKRGEELAQPTRILAVAECFEAMTAPRAHRQPFPLNRALLGLKTAARSQLDPELVEAFVAGVERLVPRFVLRDDDYVLSLEQAVREEKQKLKHVFVLIVQSFLWRFRYLVGDRAAQALECETNDFCRRHDVTVELRHGSLTDRSPSRLSPEELADTYKLTLAKAYGSVEQLLGKPVARLFLRRAIEGLSDTCREVCRSYRLCPMIAV